MKAGDKVERIVNKNFIYNRILIINIEIILAIILKLI